MKIYLDINNFTNPSSVIATLRSYNSVGGSLEIYIKADGYDYNELDDFKKIKRRNNFDKDDLKTCNFKVATYENFENFKLKDGETLFRIHDDTINNELKIYLFYNKNITKENLQNSLDKTIEFYNKYILKDNVNRKLKVGLVEKFDEEKDPLYKYIKSEVNEYEETIPLKSVLNNKCDIILMDNEVSFYVFTLLSFYSKFKKREKSVKSYFATFKPFSYQKMVENEVNLESLFTFSSYVITKDNDINLFVSKDISSSELFSLITFLQRLNKVTIED